MSAGAGAGLLLRDVRLSGRPERDAYPWSVPAVRAFAEFEFRSPVTFFVGENGSGKSTLLEALAIAANAVAVGAADVRDDATLAGARDLAKRLTLRFSASRPRSRVFLRAEDTFGFVQRIAREQAELRKLEEGYAAEGPVERDSGRARAIGSMRGQRSALESAYGDDPDERSHGEMFLRVLQRRIVPQGLYFFDEPETPLSPTRVLALIVMLREAATEGSQFVIATHSPILMATPGADIRLFEGGAIREAAYDDIEHVRVTRDFLNAPARYLRHLE